jgi:hypothetical protein
MKDLLTRIETAGGAAILHAHAPYEQRHALALHLAALRTAGHAVVADEVWNHNEMDGAVRITHYRSCERCKRRTNDGV